ncbi:secondary thiamine-phosphate synthase enzyme YjbQ [Bacillus sp. JJ1562]|uniref:secondary thiamine-phosphate synthase enzyme YjbQ n=1 Tax=Bacillus sp. JJ1562 TaxID=3122960 RepID=UPI003002523D
MLKQNELNTNEKYQLIEITNQVKEVITQSNVTNGLCVIFVPHNDAGVVINSVDDPLIQEDVIDDLTRMFPSRDNFQFEGSLTEGSAHSKSSIVGPSLDVIIENGELVLTKSQGIFFSEFNGPQQRQFYVKAFGN